MKYVIHKTKLTVRDSQELSFPFAAKFLCVKEKENEIFIWYSFAALEGFQMRTIVFIGAGRSFDPEGLTYIGTVFQRSFVWHIFEKCE